jgi:hypothetical protein
VDEHPAHNREVLGSRPRGTTNKGYKTMASDESETTRHKYWAVATAVMVLALFAFLGVWAYCSYAYADTEGKLARERWGQLSQRVDRLEAFAQDLKVIIDVKKRIDP